MYISIIDLDSGAIFGVLRSLWCLCGRYCDEALPVRVNLATGRPDVEVMCPVCGMASEDIWHLLLQRWVARQVWALSWSLPWRTVGNWESNAAGWIQRGPCRHEFQAAQNSWRLRQCLSWMAESMRPALRIGIYVWSRYAFLCDYYIILKE